MPAPKDAHRRPTKGKPPRKARERSAGVLVYRRGAGGDVSFLLLDYGRYWDFAKGHVEAGEDDTAAAVRELEEETGLKNVPLHPTFSREIRYFFRKGPTLIDKTVCFFLGEAPADARVRISDEHEGHRWATYGEALGLVKHDNARATLRAAAEALGLDDGG